MLNEVCVSLYGLLQLYREHVPDFFAGSLEWLSLGIVFRNFFVEGVVAGRVSVSAARFVPLLAEDMIE
jgi:hypothetical protein